MPEACPYRDGQVFSDTLSDAGDDVLEVIALGEVEGAAQTVARHVDRAWLIAREHADP